MSNEQQQPEPQPVAPIAVHFNVPMPDGRTINLPVDAAYALRNNLNAVISQYEAAQPKKPAPKRKRAPQRRTSGKAKK